MKWSSQRNVWYILMLLLPLTELHYTRRRYYSSWGIRCRVNRVCVSPREMKLQNMSLRWSERVRDRYSILYQMSSPGIAVNIPFTRSARIYNLMITTKSKYVATSAKSLDFLTEGLKSNSWYRIEMWLKFHWQICCEQNLYSRRGFGVVPVHGKP